MATRLMQMKCQNCGANLELDLDNLIAFCPYCGAKLLVDIDQLHQVLIAKEQTKQVIAKEQTKQKVIEADNKIKYDNFQYELEKRKYDEQEKKNWDEVKKGLPIIILLFAAVILFTYIGTHFGWLK